MIILITCLKHTWVNSNSLKPFPGRIGGSPGVVSSMNKPVANLPGHRRNKNRIFSSWDDVIKDNPRAISTAFPCEVIERRLAKLPWFLPQFPLTFLWVLLTRALGFLNITVDLEP